MAQPPKASQKAAAPAKSPPASPPASKAAKAVLVLSAKAASALSRGSAPTASGKAAPAKAAPPMTDAQRAYESRRAAKAGLSLEKWLAAKEKERVAERKEAEKAAAVRAAEAAPPKPPGMLRRLLDRAQQPLKR